MSTASAVRIEVEDAGPVTRTLKVEVPAERVAAARGSLVQRYRQQAKIPGFRPGKAPLNVVERTYKDDIDQAILEQLIRDSIDEALAQVEGNVLNVHSVQPEPLLSEAPFRYQATLEVPPSFKLAGYKKLKAKQPIKEIADADVDRVLDSLRERAGGWRPAGDGETAATGDRVTLSYQATRDGEPVPDGSATDYTAELGGGQLHPKFEEHLVGQAAGADVGFDLTFGTDDAPSDELQGATVHFDVQLAAVEKQQLPELDDDFAGKMLEGADLKALRARIESDLKAQTEQEAKNAVEEQLVRQLVEENNFDVPRGVVERRQQQLAEETAHRLLHQGYPEQTVRQLVPMLLGESRLKAERDVRLSFILDAIAEAENVGVADEELEAELAKIAQSQGQAPEAMVARAKEEGFYERLRGELRGRKALDAVRAAAKLSDVDPEEYRKEREAAREAEALAHSHDHDHDHAHEHDHSHDEPPK